MLKQRRLEGDIGPWDEERGSTFYKLEKHNRKLVQALPKHLTLTARNTEAHIHSKMSKNYVTIHALHTLSTIALYREYLAFAPYFKKGPMGPIDEPFLKGEPKDKEYWIKQARDCFGACKVFVDLLQACRKANAFVESPIVGWATYIVAWCGESFIPTFFSPSNKAKCHQLSIATTSPEWTPTEYCPPVLRTLHGNLPTT
jgi:hypothetical protein